MSAPLDHRADVYRETAVAVVINGVLSLVFALLSAHGRATAPLWGVGGIAFDFLPQLFMMIFATTLAVTLLMRRRIREGRTSALPAGRFPVPENALARAILFGLLSALVLAPLSVGVLVAAGVTGAPSETFVVAKVIYGMAVTLGLAPPIVLAALRQPRYRPTSQTAGVS